MEELVELRRVVVEALALVLVGPTAMSMTSSNMTGTVSLLLVHLDLEANDVTILDLTLRERHLLLHDLDHPGFDFLVGRKGYI